MATHDIERERWGAFFDEFSRRRQGMLVTIEAVAPESGPQVETRGLPFVGITLDRKGSGGDTIEILTGTERDDHLSHTIPAPTRVYHKTGAGVMSDEVNPDEILEITSSGDPPITYLRFQRPPDAQ